MSKFEAQTDFIDQKHATTEIYLKAGPGFRQSVSGSDRRYWSDEMKEALGIGGFPVELILNSHPLLPVPAVQFEKNPESISELFNKKINIFVSFPHRIFRHKIPGYLFKNSDNSHHRERVKIMALQTKNEILASTA